MKLQKMLQKIEQICESDSLIIKHILFALEENAHHRPL
jgi:hypothetical protein